MTGKKRPGMTSSTSPASGATAPARRGPATASIATTGGRDARPCSAPGRAALVVVVRIDVERVGGAAGARLRAVREAAVTDIYSRGRAVRRVAVRLGEERMEGLVVAIDRHAFVVAREVAAGERRHEHVERAADVRGLVEVERPGRPLRSAGDGARSRADPQIAVDRPHVGSEVGMAQAVVVDADLPELVDLDRRREARSVLREVDPLR